MNTKLWFVTDGIRVIGVFNDDQTAKKEKERFQDDSDYEYYDHYEIGTKDLEHYPDEYDLALQKGFLDE